MIYCICSDFQRYFGLSYLRLKSHFRKTIAAAIHPGFRTSCYLRFKTTVHRRPIAVRVILAPVVLLVKLFLAPATSCDISPGAEIGPGLFLPHPIGVVIAPQSKLGKNCSLFSDVVLGINHLNGERSGPTLDENVTVYTGAKIIGGVHIGANVIVGANSVVTKDIPPNAVIAGVPAKTIRYRVDTSQITF